MRVLMLATSFPKYAGDTTAPFIAEIAAGVAAHGVQVRMLLPHHHDFEHQPCERGVELCIFRYAPHPALAVWGYAESLHADVGLRANALYAAPFALSATFMALQRHIREFRPDVIHAHWVLPNGLPAWLIARWYGIPLVISMHGSDVSMAERNGMFTQMTRRIFADTAFATACSGDLHRRALALGAHASTTVVLPYGVATQDFDPALRNRAWCAQRFGIATDAPMLVAVGRFVVKKGFHVLIRALPMLRARFAQLKLVLAGYGDLQEDYAQLAASLGVTDMIIMPGQLLRDEVARTIASADVYCVPSVHDELGNVDGLPNALLEGMAAGCAIVASDVAGIPDVLTHQQHGLLVSEGDATALANAIATLLDDRSYAASLAHAARERVMHTLSWSYVTAKLVQAYTKVVT
ncbi:MAG: glycosyltransferase [Roseiflexaceae bacterium]